jgi:hypothetical protein
MPQKFGFNHDNKKLTRYEVIKLHIVALERANAANDEKTTKHITALLAQLEGSRGGSGGGGINSKSVFVRDLVKGGLPVLPELG